MNRLFNRRQFLAVSATASATLATGYSPHQCIAEEVKPSVEKGVAWYNVEQWGVEGKGWSETARYFDRLPAKAEKTVRGAVWNLSRHSAGMLVRFETDATEIHARYKLLSGNLAMSHMPATGVSGLDLYARDEYGADRWLAVARPNAQNFNAKLVSGVDPRPNGKPRLYTVYLPLYNGVDKLEFGVPKANTFIPVKPRDEKPIVFYGTSIMHGACASRPGMSISGILGRRLNRPVINLGFSGNGRLEPEVGELLCELDPAVYAVDCLPNLSGPSIEQKAITLVELLRKHRPETPILLVEDRTYTYAPFRKSARDRHAGSREALQKAYAKLQSAGVKNLHYLKGDQLLGNDGEAATDGSHPNDLGMVRYADAYEPVLRKVLKTA